MRKIKRFMILSLLALACSSPTTGGLVPGSFIAIGSVSQADGSGVASVRVGVSVHEGHEGCATRPMGPVASTGTTDDAGSFQVRVNYLHVSDFPACAVARAELPSGAFVTSRGVEVVIRQGDGGEQSDTARFDLVIPDQDH